MHNMTELTEGSEYWNPELLAQSLLGIWFAAAHQPWMNLNFIILELCARKDWQVALREELEEHDSLDYKLLEQLPLLDGFIKETVRLNPLDTRMMTPIEFCWG
jgi:cytochrome P450